MVFRILDGEKFKRNLKIFRIYLYFGFRIFDFGLTQFRII